MADYKIANIKWLRDKGWSIPSSYADSICPTYNEIVNEIPKGSTTVDVNETCIATSQAYSNNQLVCENDIHETVAEWVDLGLPSGKLWRAWNVGSSSESEYGNYYQYGKGSRQYAATSAETSYTGTEDPLSSSLDAATQALNNANVHMPTVTEYKELTANTTYSNVTINGISGGKFTSSNGNYIFLPFGGEYNNGTKELVGSYGYYLSSTPNGFKSFYRMIVNSNGTYYDGRSRTLGFMVRPVSGTTTDDCSVYNFTTSTSIIDPMSGNVPIAHSSHLNNLEQLTPTIKDGGGFLTGITAYTIYEDEREWEYRGYFNTTTSSSDRTATIEYKNGDGTCTFTQELVMKGGSINLTTLTLDNGSTVDIEGSGELTEAMIEPYETTITKAEIKNTCTSIGNYALSGCTSLTSVTIPNSVTRIGKCAFAHCTSLTNVTIPSSVATIANGTFGRCTSLTSVTIPNSVTRIGNAAFELCHLTSITIPNSVVDIDIHAFSECYFLTSVTMSNTITSIGVCAFANCHGITSITLPSSIEKIGDAAFAGCRTVTSITCNATTPPSLGKDAFDATRGRIYVPSASVETYKSASGWSTYKPRITAIQ